MSNFLGNPNRDYRGEHDQKLHEIKGKVNSIVDPTRFEHFYESVIYRDFFNSTVGASSIIMEVLDVTSLKILEMSFSQELDAEDVQKGYVGIIRVTVTSNRGEKIVPFAVVSKTFYGVNRPVKHALQKGEGTWLESAEFYQAVKILENGEPLHTVSLVKYTYPDGSDGGVFGYLPFSSGKRKSRKEKDADGNWPNSWR